MSLQEEIKRIHDEYYNGGKFIKPSFKYIVVIDQTFGQHGDDFYVCNHLDKAKEKALELLSLTKDQKLKHTEESHCMEAASKMHK